MKSILITGLLVLLAVSVHAVETDPLWEQYISAKITFQNELAALLIQSNPEFEELVQIQRDLQIAMARQRQLKYYHLLQTDPGRIVRDQGVSKWSNFDWTDEDEQRLLKANPEYAALVKAESKLKALNQGHPQWPEVRNRFADTMKSKAYEKILKTLMEAVAEIDNALKGTQ